MLRSAQGVVVDAAVLSDPGRDPEKQVNEDSIAFTETRFGIAGIVCDGMGGHDAGELASRTAVERILEVLRGEPQPLESLLSTALERAHAEVYALGGNAPIDGRPGSTAVLLALSGREGLVAHVGDSRAYRIRARHVERLTRDHSVVEALLAAGAITPEQANLHPDANRITRALGIAPEIEPELSAPIHVEAGDAFVLCTDGLSDLVNELELSELVSGSPSPEAACESLVLLANQRGGHDNISVLALRVLALGPGIRTRETIGSSARAEPGFHKAASQSTAPITAPSPMLEGERETLVGAGLAEGQTPAPQARSLSSEAETVIDHPGFTVLMGTSEVIPKTIHQPSDPRKSAPTLVDAQVAAFSPNKTVSGEETPPITSPFDPRTSGRSMNSGVPSEAQSRQSPREGEVRILLWATVAACGMIFLLIVVWWLVR